MAPAVLATAIALASVQAETTTPAEVVRPQRSVAPGEVQLVELGRRLFFDPAMSALGERSCASCHDPEHGFSDRGVLSEDDSGPTPRHSQSLIDVDTSMPMHWDGGIPDLESVARTRMSAATGSGYDGSGGRSDLRARMADLFSDRDPGLRATEAVRKLGPSVVVNRLGLAPPAGHVARPRCRADPG
jgi:cytochrome c peroxidase